MEKPEPVPPFILDAFEKAIALASRYVGATSPNPPVGAAALDVDGKILSIQAHERAGELHAERKVLDQCRELGVLDRVHSLVVTLEPCDHWGKTPPCTQAILEARVPETWFGAYDPNPNVPGKGSETLKRRHFVVHGPEAFPDELRRRCQFLVRAFTKWVTTGIPWVVVKTAYDAQGGMLPPPGRKTFTSAESLRLAHAIRKQCDAILTGSGTVLDDLPEFTVRHVEDHLGKKRYLVVLDRRGRVPPDWIQGRKSAGFEVMIQQDLYQALESLGKLGVLQVLVEAGPELSQHVLSSGAWDENVVIQSGNPDRITHVYRNS